MAPANSCKDSDQCAYATCVRLFTYDPHECKICDGNPCQECSQMESLDSQISQVHSQLLQLARRRHALKTKINQRHERFINHLPLELSSQIFTEYVHQVHDTFDPKKVSRPIYTRDWSPALFLSSICAKWRKIAFGTPQIWRFISILLPQGDPDVDLKIDLLNEYVARAGQCTLFIRVFHFKQNGDLDIFKFEPLFDAIREVSCRSEEISLWGLPPDALELIIPDETPALRTVQIAYDLGDFEYGEGPLGWNVGDIPLAGPLLRNLDFEFASALLMCTQIGWDTITTVNMSAINVTDALCILRHASRLASCSFVFESFMFEEGYYTNYGNPPGPIINRALRKLHIDSSFDVEFMETFARSVSLPFLRDFSLISSTLPNMKPLFERFHSRVRTLALTLEKKTPEDDVLKLLKILPSVEHFALNSVEPITNNFFEKLRNSRFESNASIEEPLLPKLSSLSYTGAMDFTWPAFLEMFRLPGNVEHAAERPLSEVCLKLKLQEGIIGDLGVIARLCQVQQLGIKLTVTDFAGKNLLDVSSA